MLTCAIVYATYNLNEYLLKTVKQRYHTIPQNWGGVGKEIKPNLRIFRQSVIAIRMLCMLLCTCQSESVGIGVCNIGTQHHRLCPNAASITGKFLFH